MFHDLRCRDCDKLTMKRYRQKREAKSG
jgi:phage FluMu protein Com